jgi:hypothetical protein
MLPNLLLQNHSIDMDSGSKYAIWTGDGGYFSGVFGGGKSFRSDPMMATKYDTEHEAKEAALDELGMDPQEFEVRQVQ